MFALTCPTCGDPGVESWESKIAAHEDVDEGAPNNPLQTRGEFVEIGFVCSAGHDLKIVTGNHKGSQYLGVFSGAIQTTAPTTRFVVPGNGR
jgi:hypothetical protein